MQSNIAVHDTDKKQGNAMNSNPNRCGSSKEKQMNAITKATSVAVLVTLGLALATWAAEPPKPESPADLDKLVGQPADIAPSAYQYRADRPPDRNPPESWIALMQYARLPFTQPVDVNAPAVRRVLLSLLWEEFRPLRRVELTWAADARRVPRADELAVTYLDAKGKASTWWNNLDATKQAGKPTVSADGRMFVYDIPTDTCGVVVSLTGPKDAAEYDVPRVRALVPEVWKKVDIRIEWGFDKATADRDYGGRVEAYDGMLADVRPLADDGGTAITGPTEWRSVRKGGGPRGLTAALLYQGTSRRRAVWPYNAQVADVARTIVTVWTRSGNFSFLASDLEHGPILAPEYGFFVRATGKPQAGQAVPAQRLLSDRIEPDPLHPAVSGWTRGGAHGVWVCANAGKEPVRSPVQMPARTVSVMLDWDHGVVITWRSPIQGRVVVTPTVGGGTWKMVRRTNAGEEPVAAVRGKPTELAVQAGDTVSLVLPGGNGRGRSDVELTVAEVGQESRTWSLAKDVLDNIGAGNPHADSLGNQGVWSFHSLMMPSSGPLAQAPDAATAADFIKELAARNLKTIRQRVRESPEQTWQGAMAAHGKANSPPIPKHPRWTPAMKCTNLCTHDRTDGILPAMQVQVPCENLTAQWNLGAWHLLRHSPKVDGKWRFNDYYYGILASETYMILRALDLMGMHKEAADCLDQWLSLPMRRKQPVGNFSDGNGCLTHAEGPPGVGGQMDGVHSMGPGAIGWTILEHYSLTGDEAWLKANAPRIKANADWILRQRRLLTGVVPGGDRLWCKGLQPAHQETPDSGGLFMQYYQSEAYYWLAVKSLAEALARVDPDEGTRLAAEAEAYRKDLLAAVERSIAVSPVVPVRDGSYRSFIPFGCYVRGPGSGAWSWKRPGTGAHVGGLYWDTVQSATALISPAGLLPPDDPRVQGHLDVLEDRLLLENPKLSSRRKALAEQQWFAPGSWQYQCGLERHANVHITADDAPNFLRSTLNQYAVDVIPGAGYIFGEHLGGGADKIFEEAAFLERFRMMLVMEDGDTLWLARATPRAWLEQGKTISVKNAPTHFGTVACEIVSDVDHGKIGATVEMPARKAPKEVVLRFRHPKSAPIKNVTVNGPSTGSGQGKPWTEFNKDKETITLKGLTGTVAVTAQY